MSFFFNWFICVIFSQKKRERERENEIVIGLINYFPFSPFPSKQHSTQWNIIIPSFPFLPNPCPFHSHKIATPVYLETNLYSVEHEKHYCDRKQIEKKRHSTFHLGHLFHESLKSHGQMFYKFFLIYFTYTHSSGCWEQPE